MNDDDNDDRPTDGIDKQKTEWGELIFWLVLLYLSYLFVKEAYVTGLEKMDPGYIVIPALWIMVLPGYLYLHVKTIKDLGFGWFFAGLKYVGFLALFVIVISILSMCSGDIGGLPDNIRM